MRYSTAQLAEIIQAKVIGSEDLYISQIFYDSRNITSPSEAVFFAIEAIHDGHLFMEEAYQKSVRIFVCRHIINPQEDAVYLVVENPIKALQQWAAYHISQSKELVTLGITGSNGKTIVKEWLYQCIWDQYSIIRSPKSFNSQIGLPLSMLQTEPENDLGIFEVGISKPGEMDKQESILQPSIGVLTNILSAHAEYFKDREEHIQEKIKLFKHSKVIIYHSENKEVENQIKAIYSNKKLISFGSPKADIHLVNQVLQEEGSLLQVSVFGEVIEYHIPFTDEASVQNILCVLAILYELKQETELIKERIKTLQAVSMRLELVEGNNDCIIINDSFSSDYKSLEIALNFLFQQNKIEKVLILSDVLQLGIPENELYRKIASLVNRFSIESLLLVGEKLNIYKDLFTAPKKSFNNTQELLSFLETTAFYNTAILIKGARKFQLEKVVDILENQTHNTILEVNLHALIANVNCIKSNLKPTTKIIAMVKASSYGVGNFEVAEILQHYRTDYLGVAIADEGVLLRKKGIYMPIMVMNPEIGSYQSIIDYNLEPEIYSFRVLEKFIQKLKEKSISKPYPIHIKIDTGMHRLGFSLQEVEDLANLLAVTPYVEVKSVFSHFSVSEDPNQEEFTREQATKLQKAYEKVIAKLSYKPFLHLCNTSGAINYPEYQFDAVRIGIGMYGYVDHPDTLKKLETVITLKTVISNIHHISKGETVGYGRRFTAEKDTIIATLPIGYADGIRRMVGNGIGYVRLHGKKAPIVGSVCMDMMMIEVTDIHCKEGDTVIVLGNSPSLVEYAQWCQTIPYEILTSISPRVKRLYYRE